MANRVELNTEELGNVVGGAIVWKGNGTCYAKDDPSTVYHFDVNQIDAIMVYIKEHNGGAAHNAATLAMLKAAGYVW